MLTRIVQFVLQALAAWAFTATISEPIARGLGLQRDYAVFVYAIIAVLIVMVVGYASAVVLKDLRTPSKGTFIVSLALAVLFALLPIIPGVRDAIEGAVPALQSWRSYYPVVGALIGYLVKR